MKILIIAINLFKRNLYKKYTLIIYVFLPVIGLLLSLLIYNNTDSINVSILDNDNSYLSRELIAVIKDSHNINSTVLTKMDSNKKLYYDNTSVIVVIPKSFESKIFNNSDITIDVISKNSSRKVKVIANQIDTYIHTLKNIGRIASGNLDTYFKIYNKVNFEKIVVKEKLINGNVNTLVSAIGYIMIFNLMIVTNTLSGIIKDTQNLVWTRITLTDTTPSEYIKGQLLWSLILSIVQCVISLIIIEVFHIYIGISYLSYCVLFALITIISLSVGLLIISLCNTEEQIPIISTLIIFPSAMLSGCLWPIEIMSKLLQNISYLFPQRYVFEFLYRLQSRSNNYILVVYSVLILLISILLIYIASIKIERRMEWK